MPRTIRTRIGGVNTLSHYVFANNALMEFKDWLKSEMDARKLGPSDLARMAKVPQPTIFRILSGETKDPRSGTVKKIEAALRSQSPPLETKEPVIVEEMAGLWPYLLPNEQAEILEDIQRRAAHNRAVLDMKDKPAPATENPPATVERRRGAVWFGFPDRRQKREVGNEN